MIQPIILAAGKGTRMKSETPKVLHRLGGKTFLHRVIGAIQEADELSDPLIVVGEHENLIKEAIGNSHNYMRQDVQRGTAHAVKICEPHLKNKAGSIIVLYGDHPLITSESLDNIAQHHLAHRPAITFFSTIVPSFEGWYSAFSSFGRIERSVNSIKIIEKKDATPIQLQITELNPGIYCFDANWLWEALSQIRPDNAAGEYYLTDLIALAVSHKKQIETLNLPPEEALGINTPEDLQVAEGLIQNII
ncbi:hypothetical protein EPN15_00800 [Patescibacteria group bacterium]|nr:MAG: hypothetical protein EPN15_00800 [Patescibacteria group bacterium]